MVIGLLIHKLKIFHKYKTYSQVGFFYLRIIHIFVTMIAKLKLEEVFIVEGSVVLCGPIEEGEITLSSFVKIDDLLIPISRIEVFRKFVTKVKKGDNPGLFLDKDFNHIMRLDNMKTNGRGKTIFDELVYKRSNVLINIISLQQVREDKLNQLGI